jgi:ATP-dependent protease ClpP protease subunit
MQTKNKREQIDYRLEAEEHDGKCVVYLYGDIADEQPVNFWTGEAEDGDYIIPKNVREMIDKIDAPELEIHLNSYGGSVFASVAIFNYLKALDKRITVVIDAIAASGASLIAMAADEIIMPANAMLMIHRASASGWGNCNDLREVADTLEKLDNSVVFNTLKSRYKGDAEELKALVDAETWLTAEECLANGLCDKIVPLEEKAEEKPQEPVEEGEIKNALKFMKNFANLKTRGEL